MLRLIIQTKRQHKNSMMKEACADMEARTRTSPFMDKIKKAPPLLKQTVRVNATKMKRKTGLKKQRVAPEKLKKNAVVRNRESWIQIQKTTRKTIPTCSISQRSKMYERSSSMEPWKKHTLRSRGKIRKRVKKWDDDINEFIRSKKDATN